MSRRRPGPPTAFEDISADLAAQAVARAALHAATRHCAGCGEPFIPPSPLTAYHSEPCRRAAERRRRRAARAARPGG